MKGYTLIEFIIYIGLATVVLLSSLSFGWMILQDEIKQNVIAEVSYNSNFVQNKLLYHAKRANEIDAETTYGINPGVFVLNFPNTDQITIDTYNKDVMLGASEQSITKLRFTEGSDPSLDLTSDKVDVTNFTITSLALPGASTVQIELTIQYLNPSNDKNYEAVETTTISLTPRAQ